MYLYSWDLYCEIIWIVKRFIVYNIRVVGIVILKGYMKDYVFYELCLVLVWRLKSVEIVKRYCETKLWNVYVWNDIILWDDFVFLMNIMKKKRFLNFRLWNEYGLENKLYWCCYLVFFCILKYLFWI